jgi:hypothetical protein
MALRGTWQPVKPRPPVRPSVSSELQADILAQAEPVIAKLQKRLCNPPGEADVNWCERIFSRWHRGSLYFVGVMRTPHGRPPSFETHLVRMQYVGDGKFDVAFPMRRGWATASRALSVSDCLREILKTTPL